MSDYQNDQRANRWAERRGKWIVYGCLPLLLLLAIFGGDILAGIRELATDVRGILCWSFCK